MSQTQKVNKAALARNIVASVYANSKIEDKDVRSTAIAQILEQTGCGDRMAHTYQGNAIIALMSVEENDGTIAERMENGKPVWSVVKIRSENNPVISTFYRFSSKKGAEEANAALRFDGVYKGDQTQGAEPVRA